MSSGADLFVVCKQCGSEVSPYITECPYCGSRLRKRAPKLEKARKQEERRRRRADAPRLGRLRAGEIPGIRPDVRPYATLTLLLAAVALTAVERIGPSGFTFDDVAVSGSLRDRPWRVVTAPFLYLNTGYLICALAGVALFGWLLERRHGPLVPVLVFLAGGAAGMALAAAVAPTSALVSGGNGAALALLCAWAIPDLQARRAGEETDSDMLGVAAFAAVLLLLPVAVPEADPLAGLGGAVVGLVLGVPVAALSRGR